MSLLDARSTPQNALPPAGVPVLYHGWMLKKRRKKMQGFARRYFVLHQSGILSYSFEPGQPVRDQVSLHHAAISTAPGRKDIHIDSNTATFHVKCLSTEDFNKWMAVFRKFTAMGTEARRSASVRMTARRRSLGFSKSGLIVEEMASTIASLEVSLSDLASLTRKQTSLGKRSEKDKSKEKEHPKDGKFGLFKKVHHSHVNEFGVEHAEASQEHLTSSIRQIFSILETLKTQHSTLARSLSNADAGTTSPTHVLPPTAEEHPERELSPAYRHSKRSSTTTTESINEWFDALDGAEEFIMDAHATVDTSEPPSRMPDHESGSSLDQSEDSSIDTDIEEDQDTSLGFPSEETRGSSMQNALVMHRTQLPSAPVGDEGSLFTILKKNVGKDLASIAFPVTFNEPLTLLQRAAEEIEYYSLLDQAAGSADPTDRICYVAAFAVSGYAHTRHRSGRKGFNPMLGETFEDPRMKFIAEKVRHNPLEMAYHAEGDKWELHATSAGRTKFWGKSLEIIPLGATHVKIGDDHYVWTRPSSFMRNLMVGTKYLEHCGKMSIENKTSRARCVLEFKQNGYWGPSNVVEGIVYGPSGDIVGRLEGKWDDQLSQTLDSSHFRVLWRMTPFPKNAPEYYGFTSFGVTLNEITSDIEGRLPSTDSRLRPDVRALENGDIDVAEEEKVRIEEMQRERRRKGRDRQPRWFRPVGDEWIYVGGYWEARNRGWKGEDMQPLW